MPSVWLFGVAAVASMVATTASMIATLVGRSVGATTWIMVVFTSAVALLIVGALHPSASRLTQVDGRPSTTRVSRSRIVVLGIALAASPLIAARAALHGQAALAIGPPMLVTALVLWRLWRLIHEREAARALARVRARQQSAVADLGLAAMSADDLDGLFADAAERAAALLDADAVTILRLDDQGVHRSVAHVGDEHALADIAYELGVAPGTVVVVDGDGRSHPVDVNADAPPARADVAEVGLGTGQVTWGVLRVRLVRPFRMTDVRFLVSLSLVLGAALEHHLAAARLRHDALHDTLTGLPNRTLLADRLDLALRSATRAPHDVAVLFLDLDGFKQVNDTLGHDAGDDLLVAVARRLRREVRDGDTLARFAGDEFVVVCDPVDGVEPAMAIADRMVAALDPPFHLRGREARVGVSAGVVVAEGGAASPGDLLRAADAAMYRAKSRGKGEAVLADHRSLRRSA